MIPTGINDVELDSLGYDPSDYDDTPDPSELEDSNSRSLYCPTCQKQIDSVMQDNGIGPYEFWGQQGTHHDWVEVCPECEEDASEYFTSKEAYEASLTSDFDEVG